MFSALVIARIAAYYIGKWAPMQHCIALVPICPKEEAAAQGVDVGGEMALMMAV